MRTRIKICGITNLADAEKAVELGADALGFVFAESPRMVKPSIVKDIARALPSFVSKIGVFVNEEINTLRELYSNCRLDAVQLHGNETIEYIKAINIAFIKAFRVNSDDIINQIKEYDLPCFLLDSFDKNKSGGTGKTFDWQIANKVSKFGKVILSGGLNPANIKIALEKVNPYAVDVSSGIEKIPGVKDHEKMEYFIKEVQLWDSRIN